MLKPNGKPAPGTGKLATDDPLAWKGLPNLRAFFLDQTYGADSEERQPGLLIVKASRDGWQFTLKDCSSCQMLKVTGRTWDETCLIVEGLLGDPEAPWETDPYETQKRARSRGRKAP